MKLSQIWKTGTEAEQMNCIQRIRVILDQLFDRDAVAIRYPIEIHPVILYRNPLHRSERHFLTRICFEKLYSFVPEAFQSVIRRQVELDENVSKSWDELRKLRRSLCAKRLNNAQTFGQRPIVRLLREVD